MTPGLPNDGLALALVAIALLLFGMGVVVVVALVPRGPCQLVGHRWQTVMERDVLILSRQWTTTAEQVCLRCGRCRLKDLGRQSSCLPS